MDAKRDWGYAPEYMEAAWLMLQQEEPDDYVIATEIIHSVREFVESAFAAVDMAMVVEALPLPEKAAQDMGIWHTSLVVPQMIATPIAGAMLDKVKRDSGLHQAYAAVFGMAVAYFSLGTIFVSKLKNIK